MGAGFGKLILLIPGEPDQEFELAKASISLGRAVTNDVVLGDILVSRHHARLQCESSAVTLFDLGSSNGTWINGERIDQARLNPRDLIGIGDCRLRYEIEGPRQDQALTLLDASLPVEELLDDEFLPVAINETSTPCLVVFGADRTWQVDLQDLDRASIGRDENCTICLGSGNVSRRHAEVQRLGDCFFLKDLGSRNGTWLRGIKVEEQILQDGDGFRIGSAQIIFKRGFQQQALSLPEEALKKPASRRKVIFIPGMMGSELWCGSERLWPDMKTIFSHPEVFTYPSASPIEARGIVDQVVIIPNLIKQDQYRRLGEYLVEELNYQQDVDYFEFAYDWRQDVRLSARQLAARVESLPGKEPLVLVAHSLGALVARYYIECLGGKRRVERAILMGGPHLGTVKSLTSMLIAPDVLPFGLLGERLRQILFTFPTSYQILPVYPVGTDQDGQQINFLQDDCWLSASCRKLLRAGRDFRQELGSSASIPYVSIFGYGIKTISHVSVVRDRSGKFLKADYLSENAGDGTILEQSAYLEGSEIHPVHQHHGSLFVDNDVKMRLKLELTRPC